MVSYSGKLATVCSQSIRPAVPARTAPPQMRSWVGEGGSGHCGLLRPPELCAVGPDASQDHSYLARDGNLGLFRTDAPRQAGSPSLEWRPTLDFREQHAGSFKEAGPREAIAALRYFSLSVRFSGLISTWCQSEIRTYVARSLEAVGFVNGGAERQGGNGANAG